MEKLINLTASSSLSLEITDLAFDKRNLSFFLSFFIVVKKKVLGQSQKPKSAVSVQSSVWKRNQNKVGPAGKKEKLAPGEVHHSSIPESSIAKRGPGTWSHPRAWSAQAGGETQSKKLRITDAFPLVILRINTSYIVGW